MEIRLKFLLFVVALTAWSPGDVSGQARVRKLSTIINHPSLNLYAPFISADANAVIFLSDNAEDNALTPFFSYRDRGDWKEPQVLPKIINTRLNFLRGFGLSADGTALYFSTMKSPGVGGFDICVSEWRGGNAWTSPTNLGAPINSRLHEACPSITPDGKTLYFMRCTQMNQTSASGCSIFRVEKRSNGTWGEPQELPARINTGNSQTPRIAADGETLIFSSDKMGTSKGGMDLYVTRLENGSWTSPQALDFVNTDGDDQYVSVSALGRYLLRDSPGARKHELVEYLIPDHLRPRGMMKIEGKVTDEAGKPLQSYISLVDVNSGARVYNGRPNSDGTFLLYAREGAEYELAFDPEHGNRNFYSTTFDLTVDPIPQVERVQAVLPPVLPGDEWDAHGIAFREHSAEIDMTKSSRTLQRFSRLIASNPDLGFEVEVMLEGYQEDSLQSDPDLTEIRIDTVHWLYVDIDTLGQLYERDTASVKTIYHNDRTKEQAQAVIAYLVSQGAEEGRLTGRTAALPVVLRGERRTLLKIRALRR